MLKVLREYTHTHTHTHTHTGNLRKLFEQSERATGKKIWQTRFFKEKSWMTMNGASETSGEGYREKDLADEIFQRKILDDDERSEAERKQ